MLKKILLAFVILLPAMLFSQTKTALFIGNSYTYSNNTIPMWVSKIALSLGDTLSYSMYAPGGFQLNQHATSINTLDSIASRNWDYVVLQEQSQMPAFSPEQVAQEVYPYAEILCDSIFSNNACSIPLFFMTWGRENGDQTNCDVYPPICTYEGMQNRLRESYIEMAQLNDGQVAPVGVVWKALREASLDTLDLYSSDGSHPSILGTYLAACTFYASMFHESPVGAIIPNDVEPDDALMVQEFAAQIVFDSLDVWMIDTTNVYAYFEQQFLVKGPEVYLNSQCVNADSAFWNFGDGTSLWQYDNLEYGSISHSLPAYENYIVCLTAYRGCKQDTYCGEVLGIDSSIPDYTRNFKIYPNPANNEIFISNENLNILEIQIIDSQGRTLGLIVKAVSPLITIDVRDFIKGLYYLKIVTNNNCYTEPFLVE